MKVEKIIMEILKSKGEKSLEIKNLHPIQIFYLFKQHTDKCIDNTAKILRENKQDVIKSPKCISELPARDALELLDEEVTDSEDCALSNEDLEESDY